ncbi:MAG TPA: respiratory nitrate reductase subunit gamma [Thermoanaerobaculia bacterium]|nr:respiratory nitrate reductase subunit gamma [Thermoanaerobaculia bacterium]
MNAQPVDYLVLLALPYAAILAFVAGVVWRTRHRSFSVSSLSSQFLESRWIPWGTVPFHIGIVVLFIGHLIPVIAPGPWHSFVSNRGALLTVEAIGMTAAILCIAGIVILFARRVTSPSVQSTTTVMDLVVLGILLAQIAVGLGVAVLHRWGALWSVGTTTPYLWSLLTLRPDPALAAGMPPLMKLHLAGAWIVLALVPYTRLVHMFAIPFQYLRRPPQKVVWANPRRQLALEEETHHEIASRRLLLQGAIGVGAAGVLLSIGVLGKLFNYFRGTDMTEAQETDQLETRLRRLEMTAEQRSLQLERMRSAYIRVARLGDLQPTSGAYFIDYQMRPALAFRGADGFPHLISAKCTHLACTVAKDVNAEGRILCPCHVSWFDLATGAPTAGSPAKAPLPILGWVLRDQAGRIVASRAPDGTMEAEAGAEMRDDLDVFISRSFAKREA